MQKQLDGRLFFFLLKTHPITINPSPLPPNKRPLANRRARNAATRSHTHTHIVYVVHTRVSVCVDLLTSFRLLPPMTLTRFSSGSIHSARIYGHGGFCACRLFGWRSIWLMENFVWRLKSPESKTESPPPPRP